MKDAVKITVIAAGFKDVARRPVQQKPSYLPKTWKAGREPQTVVQEVQRNVQEVLPQVAADDLDVPTFLRRQAQKA